MPPADVIPEVIRSITEYMKTMNAAIFYDTSFGITCYCKHSHIDEFL